MDGNRLGPFMLLEKLGEGGMGVVYKAHDTRLERLVAIKVLPDSRVADPDRRARFMQEARAASALNHPNIVTIYDIAEEDGRHYIVMEFVDGRPLQQIIPRKGMRIAEALRIAAQIADALTAAHAAGIVHRDLKPGNIMVDTQGRAKVLDFGLAKLTPPSPSATAADETRTLVMEGPRTEAGAILGSAPYMSPEQAEGHPMDARSDIFSFGAVLYEMATGRRAFQGESRASTLAAVVERDPQPPSEIAPDVPAELERIISRCLRKEVARRSQHMSDVKLALEELRDESQSGKLTRTTSAGSAAPAAGRRWLWQAIAAACAVIAAAAVGWSVLRHEKPTAAPVQLVRLSPDDGYSYRLPAISPDGKLVASISDRSGTDQLWLQQTGGGEPIQVTHSAGNVRGAEFFPDGTRLLVWNESGGKWTFEIQPTLGGQSRVFLGGDLYRPSLSPDGTQVAYFERESGRFRLAVVSTDGGIPRVIEKWELTQGRLQMPALHWMPDGRTLVSAGTRRRDATNLDDWDAFALPVDGRDPVATGFGDTMRTAGFAIMNVVVSGNRAVISGGPRGSSHVWQLEFVPGSWRIKGVPRQLTFGTENEVAVSASPAGMVAIQTSKDSSDFYLLPLDSTTGDASGPIRRLTRDGRVKAIYGLGGDPGSLYFNVYGWAGSRGPTRSYFMLDLATAQQTEFGRGLDLAAGITVSPDGRQVAYSRPDGDSYSISVGDIGAPPETARPLCSKCGGGLRFSPDGRYLAIIPEARPKADPARTPSTAMAELSSGKITPWLSDGTESVTLWGFLGGEWPIIRSQRSGGQKTERFYVTSWNPTEAPPRPDWVEIHLPNPTWHYSVVAPFVYYFQNSRLIGMRFDPKQRRFSEPFLVHMPSGSPVDLRPTDTWSVRGPGITLVREESKGSVWLMKLPD
jgi:predicted Ser/Thr protein kinase